MNRILTTLVILLILSISPVNAVQIKETNPEHFLEEKYSNTSQILKHINKGAFTPILFIYLFKLIKKLEKEITKVTNKIKKTKEEIETDIEETRKEINQQIEEINTNELIEALGESHPLTQKIIYLKEKKPTNPIEFLKYLSTLMELGNSSEESIEERDPLKTPEELKKIKTKLKIHYLHTYICQKLLIYAAYGVIIGIIITFTGILLLFTPLVLGWGWAVVETGVTFVGTCIALLTSLDNYFSNEPEKYEKEQETLIQEIEEELKQKGEISADKLQDNLKKLKELKETKKMLETRLKDHPKIVWISENLYKVCIYFLVLGVILTVGGLIITPINLPLGLTLLGHGAALTLASIFITISSFDIYAHSDPEKRKQAIEERTQEINQQIQELEHKIKETPTTSKIENNTTMILKNNTTITSIEGGL